MMARKLARPFCEHRGGRPPSGDQRDRPAKGERGSDTQGAIRKQPSQPADWQRHQRVPVRHALDELQGKAAMRVGGFIIVVLLWLFFFIGHLVFVLFSCDRPGGYPETIPGFIGAVRRLLQYLEYVQAAVYLWIHAWLQYFEYVSCVTPIGWRPRCVRINVLPCYDLGKLYTSRPALDSDQNRHTHTTCILQSIGISISIF